MILSETTIEKAAQLAGMDTQAFIGKINELEGYLMTEIPNFKGILITPWDVCIRFYKGVNQFQIVFSISRFETRSNRLNFLPAVKEHLINMINKYEVV